MNRKWLETELAEVYIPQISAWANDRTGRTKAKKLLAQLRSNWSARGLDTLEKQKNCMAQVRRTIKDVLGDNHFSLELIRFDTQDYTDLNTIAQARVSERNEAVKYFDNPDAIVAAAVRLLESPEWSEIAAGLSVLTGRRVSELVATAHFEPKSKWSVVFTGAVKRGDEGVPLSFEIPTLTTAAKVCEALNKLRTELPEASSLSAAEINRSYSQAVIQACDRHFAGLIPLRSGRDNLYTHISRSIYAAIAVFWYCPPAVNETEFKAAIQGHYAILTEKSPEKRRSLVASRHYSDYEIADSVIAQHQGKRKGVKLGLGGITVIDAFKQAESQSIQSKATERNTVQRLRIWQSDREALEGIFERLQLSPDSTQMEKLSYLVSWAKEQLERPVEDSSGTAEADTTPIPASEREPLPATAEVSVLTPFLSNLEGTLKQLTEVMTGLVQQQAKSQSVEAIASSAATTQPGAIAPAPTSAPRPQPVAERKSRGDIADDKLISIMNRIFAYNDAPDRIHSEKWAVTIGLLKNFVKSQPRLQQFLKDHEPELSAHYQKHQIDPEKQNYKHRGTNIQDFISFE